MSEQQPSPQSAGPARRPLRLPVFRQMKQQGEKIAMITAYDYSFARIVDACGVDIVLVGDSMGNVIQGHDTTLPVTLDHMVYHTTNVGHGLERAWLVADLPFLSDHSPASAIAGAQRLMGEAGAQMVKLEGAGPALDAVDYLAQRGVPVCAHLGLTPQSVHKLGGFRVQGRKQEVAQQIAADAQALEQAGAQLLVLECVPNALAAEITASLDIPTIGIGAGPDCDGQVLVLHDVLGVSSGPWPRFVKNFMPEGGSVQKAVSAYVEAVKNGAFPDSSHSYE